MSKMPELDMDRQHVERLSTPSRPGVYRKISRAEINAFLVSAVNLAMAKPEYINGGVRVVDVALNADGIPRLDFDNGDFIFLDFEHLVPRDTVRDI